ncbi:MAG: hypothetical protein KC933_26840 [Myxococcales bacterium]|nr:hypothetical protein [Myxococcales bacterium]
MGFIDTTRMLVLLAFRNLFSHRVKTAIVGMIMLFGTLLVVMGTALVDSIERAMEQSITASLAGHLQVYSAKGKDQLALFGGGFMGADDIGRIDDFSKVQDALSKVANVEAVVPMGLEGATVTAPGELEGALERLRVAVRANDKAPLATLQAQIKELLQQMKEERKVSLTITTDTKDLNEQIAKLDEGLSETLWARFEEDPLAVLEFLDTQVAPLAEEGRLMYFRYLGTDVDLFVQHFDRFEVVKGERIPPHTRGFMFSERFYERVVKHRIARYMDRVNESLHEEDLTIADDAGLQSLIRRSARQHRYITYQLDAKESAQLTDELKALLPEVQGGLPELLAEFLTVTDENFDARYAWFYAHVAPMLEMYAIDVGDTMTVRSYTKSGFLKALNIKLFGVYRFKGLESSDLASGTNLMDMLTFRELYGLMTDAKKAELSAIKDEVGLKDVAAEDAEAAFFGEGAGEVVARVDAEGFDEFADVKLARTETVAVDRTFTQSEVDHGMALNAAVVLKDAFDFSLADIAGILGTTVGAVKAALHRGRGKLREPDLESGRVPARGVVDAFCAAFNAHDVHGLAALLLDSAAVEVVGATASHAADETREQMLRGMLFGSERLVDAATLGGIEARFVCGARPTFPRAETRIYRDEALALIWYAHEDGEHVRAINRFETDDGRIAGLRNYFFTPDAIAEVCAELGVSHRPNGYRWWLSREGCP